MINEETSSNVVYPDFDVLTDIRKCVTCLYCGAELNIDCKHLDGDFVIIKNGIHRARVEMYNRLKLSPKPLTTFDEDLIQKIQIERRKENGVVHPNHYNNHPSGIECIKIVQHHNFNIGNAIKYLWRAGLKDGEDHTKDLRKVIEYVKFELKRIGEEK